MNAKLIAECINSNCKKSSMSLDELEKKQA